MILINNIKGFLKDNIFYNIDYGQTKYQFEIFRIAICLFSLISFTFYLIDYNFFLSPDGLVSWEATDAYSNWFEPTLFKLSKYLHIQQSLILNSAILLYYFSFVTILFGYFIRIAAIIAFVLFKMFLIQLLPYVHGVELYQTVFLLFLIVIPSGFKFSLVNSKETPAKLLSQKYGIRGLQLYLIFTYFSAGLHKAIMPAWYNGEMFFMAISDPNYALFKFPTDLHYSIYAVIGILTLIIEMGYSIFLLFRWFRSFLILSIIGMHLAICFFMSLVPFGFLLALINLVLWYPLLLKDVKIIRNRLIM